MSARGFFWSWQNTRGDLCITGWMLSPFTPEIKTFALYVNQELLTIARAQTAPETFDKFRSEGTPLRFELSSSLKLKEILKFSRIDVVGFVDEGPVRRITTMFRGDLDTEVPTPPEHLMYRVTGNTNGGLVKFAGLRCATDFLDSIGRFCDLNSVRNLLDWGCGCGRVTKHLIDFLSGEGSLQVHGCDIDGEAIAWCQENLAEGSFLQVDPFPPQPWANDSFDVVVSCSVFTHLSEETQQLWLREMQRVITPGGLFLASISSGSLDSEVGCEGISDETVDHILDGIAPEGYYRGTVQSRKYTMGQWSRYFEILDFVENGMEGTQDLVVMRKPI